DSNSVFRNILLQLKKLPADWEGFAELLEEIYPGIDVAVSFDEQADEFINATTTQAGITLPIDASGTGVLQAIQILSYVFLFKPKLLILDEPDSHLHPNNQRKLGKVRISHMAREHLLVTH
ncbi:AAA family ATPase, partial [Aeromonas caviae]